MPNQRYTQMVCLVGENPLPVYFGIKQYADLDSAQIVLLHSKETKPQANNIRNFFKKDAVGAAFILRELEDAFNPLQVDALMRELKTCYPAAALNYTGGTKVMAGFGLLNWQSGASGDRGLFDHAFYLEEGSQCFHFGNRAETEPLTVPLTLSVLQKLHGVDAPQTLPEREELLPSELKDIYEKQNAKRNSIKYFGGEPKFTDLMSEKQGGFVREDIEAFQTSLVQWRQLEWQNETMPAKEEDYRGSRYERMIKCVYGGWFEQLMEQVLRRLHAEGPDKAFGISQTVDADPLIPASEILFNRTFPIEVRKWKDTLEFETDLIVIKNHRLRYISVTTSHDFRLCKSKMFEAYVRSQQLGGGMASSCVVCLGKGLYSRSLQRFLPDGFVDACRTALGNNPRHTLFGWNDVHDWMQGRTRTLRAFLTE